MLPLMSWLGILLARAEVTDRSFRDSLGLILVGFALRRVVCTQYIKELACSSVLLPHIFLRFLCIYIDDDDGNSEGLTGREGTVQHVLISA